MSLKQRQHNLIIDGNNLANICNYAAKKSNNGNSEKNSNKVTVAIFLQKLYALYDLFDPDRIIICWDKRLSKGRNFRKENIEYKATRKKGDSSLFHACDIIENLTMALGITNMHPNIMEADDIIAWLVNEKAKDDKNTIASVDHDLLQLVSDNVEFYNLITRKLITISNFESIIGVRRSRYLLYKMVLGDRSDNIEGLKGYGKIKSKRIAESNEPFNDLTTDQLKTLVKNKKLMDLKVGYTVYPEETVIYNDQFNTLDAPNSNKFFELGKEYGLKVVEDYRWKWVNIMAISKD